MGIPHRSFDVLVPEQFLNGSDVVAVLQQMGRKRMAEDVAARGHGKAGFENRLLDPSRYRGRCASSGKNEDSFGWLGGRIPLLTADS